MCVCVCVFLVDRRCPTCVNYIHHSDALNGNDALRVLVMPPLFDDSIRIITSVCCIAVMLYHCYCVHVSSTGALLGGTRFVRHGLR